MTTLYQAFEQFDRTPNDQKKDFLSTLASNTPDTYQQLLVFIAVDETKELAVDSIIDKAIMDFNNPQYSMLKNGEKIGNFEIEKLLGQGGMGCVYLAHRCDNTVEQRVAIKLLNPLLTYAKSNDFLLDEAQALANLSHENIARIYSIDALNNDQFLLVMEYIEGTSLDVYLQNNSLDLKEKLVLFKQLCEAVSFAHTHQVIHGDIKPENILVSYAGKVSLIDFGVARTSISSAKKHVINRYLCAHSPHYCSPELIQQHTVSVSTDVYALGAVLSFILYGYTPNQSFDELHLTKETSRSLHAIVNKACHVSNKQRYSSAQSMLSDLCKYQENFPVTALKTPWWFRLYLFVKRHLIAVSVCSLFFFTLLTTATYFSYQQARLINEQSANVHVLRALTQFIDQADPELIEKNNDQRLKAVKSLERHIVPNGIASMSYIRYQLAIAKAYVKVDAFEQALALLTALNQLTLNEMTTTERINAKFLIHLSIAPRFYHVNNLSAYRQHTKWAAELHKEVTLDANEVISALSGNIDVTKALDEPQYSEFMNWLENLGQVQSLSPSNQYQYYVLMHGFAFNKQDIDKQAKYIDNCLAHVRGNMSVLPAGNYRWALWAKHVHLGRHEPTAEKEFSTIESELIALLNRVPTNDNEYGNIVNNILTIKLLRNKVEAYQFYLKYKAVIEESAKYSFVAARQLAGVFFDIDKIEAAKHFRELSLTRTQLVDHSKANKWRTGIASIDMALFRFQVEGVDDDTLPMYRRGVQYLSSSSEQLMYVFYLGKLCSVFVELRNTTLADEICPNIYSLAQQKLGVESPWATVNLAPLLSYQMNGKSDKVNSKQTAERLISQLDNLPNNQKLKARLELSRYFLLNNNGLQAKIYIDMARNVVEEMFPDVYVSSHVQIDILQSQLNKLSAKTINEDVFKERAQQYICRALPLSHWLFNQFKETYEHKAKCTNNNAI